MSRHSTITNELRNLLRTAAVGDVGDVGLSTRELRAAGVPAKWADGLSRASFKVTTSQQADELAADYAHDIAADLDRADQMTPSDILARIPNL